MKLMINGMEATKGMEVTTFRGEKYILTGWKEPHKASSTGRVCCKTKNDCENDTEWVHEWFPGVIGGKFEE